MNENLVIWVNQKLVEAAIAQYFAANPSLFSGTATLEGVLFTWSAGSPPTVRIMPSQPNLILQFSGVMLQARGVVIGGGYLGMSMGAQVVIENGVLSITDITTQMSGAEGFLNALLAALINQTIEQRYAAAVAAVPIPVIPDLIGHGLSIGLRNAVTGAGYLQVTASMAFNGSAPNGPTPPPCVGDADRAPQAGIAINDAGVQTVMASVAGQFPITQPISSEETRGAGILGDFGYGVRGSAVIGLPALTINGGTASAATAISPSIDGGIEAFSRWTWVSLPVLPARVSLNVVLAGAAGGTQAQLQVTGLGSISYPTIDLPPVLKEVATPLIALIESIESSLLNSRLPGQSFTLVTLPQSLPSPYKGKLTFARLGFVNSGVGVLIDVAPT